MRTYTADAVEARVPPFHAALMGTAVVVRGAFAGLRCCYSRLDEARHNQIVGERRHLDGIAEPARKVGFETLLVSIAERLCLADLDHYATLVFRVEDARFIDELGQCGFPLFSPVGVVVHLRWLGLCIA